MLFFRNLFGCYPPVYRSWTPEGGDGDSGGGSGDGDKGDKGGDGKKFAGKYQSPEELEKAYTDLESQQGKTSKRMKELEEENKRYRQSSKKPEGDEDRKSEPGRAQKEYRKFMDETDFDDLSGRDYKDALEKRDELRDAARAERDAEAKKSHSKTSEEASQAALREIMETDTKRLLKIKGYKKDELENLIEWGDDHGCGSLTEAHYARENETLAKQIKDKDAEIAKIKLDLEKRDRHIPGMRRGEKTTDEKDDKTPGANLRLHNRGRLGKAFADPKLHESYRRMVEEQTGKKIT
jgi:hypothetical protein